MKRTTVVAHGGYSTKYPENTFGSYVAAAEAGVDVIEMDIVISADAEVFCFHPVSGVDGFDKEIEKTPSAILRTNGYSSLEKVLKALNKYDSKIYFDLKQDRLELINKSIEIAKSQGFEESEIVVGSRSEDKLKYLKKSYNVIVLGLPQDPDKYEEFFEMGGDIYRLWEKDLTRGRVEAIHKLDGEVWVTPGHKATKTQPRTAGQASKQKLEWFIELGVDGVILNDVEAISQLE
ncbi:hypothetical protein GF389_03405 [Candidatus Dojkabacteria bacterium]|nr:hypothetical protein [Candidatus Dojkabacteria bacterium]